MKRHHPSNGPTKLVLPKGLTRAAASSAAIKKVGGDFRGMKYDPKTGRTTVI